jgi:hypothetical protein
LLVAEVVSAAMEGKKILEYKVRDTRGGFGGPIPKGGEGRRAYGVGAQSAGGGGGERVDGGEENPRV